MSGVDPHAWQSVANTEIYVKNIAEALCAADAADCGAFRANAAAYTEELKALDASIKAGFAASPPKGARSSPRTTPSAISPRPTASRCLRRRASAPNSEASAADVANLIRQIRDEGVTALFVENISDPRLIEQIARETGARPGGELYSDALSEPGRPGADLCRDDAPQCRPHAGGDAGELSAGLPLPPAPF